MTEFRPPGLGIARDACHCLDHDPNGNWNVIGTSTVEGLLLLCALIEPIGHEHLGLPCPVYMLCTVLVPCEQYTNMHRPGEGK